MAGVDTYRERRHPCEPPLPPSQGQTQQTYEYDGLGRLLITSLRTYTYAGALTTATVIDGRRYDRASRAVYQSAFEIEGTSTPVYRTRFSTYTDDGLVQEQTSYRTGKIESKVVYGDSVQTGSLRSSVD